MSRTDIERKILETLADEPHYVVDLAARIDEHPVTVEGASERLRDAGEIRSTRCRRYEITAVGRRRLADVGPATGGSEAPTETESRP